MGEQPPPGEGRTLIPLYGVNEGPAAYLLHVGSLNLLLDCGWSDDFDLSVLEPLKSLLSKGDSTQLDAILISNSSLASCGALPYVVGVLGCNVPIYATLPTVKMGRLTHYDTFSARHKNGLVEPFPLDAVDNTFETITPLKYSQHVQLRRYRGPSQAEETSPPETSEEGTVCVTPHPAGHLLGACYWHISAGETDDILYALAFNNKPERHLPCVNFDKFQRPAALITSSRNALTSVSRKQLDQFFSVRPVSRFPLGSGWVGAHLDHSTYTIVQTLRNNGNVLIPTDTAGRILDRPGALAALGSH
ncbi:putative cleavage and polyadenylation specificity factor subunit 2 [Paratrimastix pyriformis]|uniref:Cleavage and polyadenylation specificity factor subunit 2 n=1 Tax=Paratrimastix pyriformis TaxID=342808 RepID=A0ABQ8UGA7_9EUKA|nr:putative cleavage and polyadenylation specificity factor subunit 2 [Paratrimastix pyriformis]